MYTAAIVTVGYLCGYEIFLHHHSFSYIDRPSWPMRYILILGGTRIHHIFLCSTMRERLESRYGRVAHAQIISNAAFVAPPSSSISTNASCGPLRIGLLSNLTREKGLHTFVELLRRLRDSELDVVGVLAGPIADENDRLFVAKAQTELLGRLLYRGPLYGDAKDRFYHDIDVFVFPTQYANEAQPTVIFEALAAGNTIVAFDRGCIQIQIGEHGVAISTTDDFCTRAHNYLKDRICRHDIPARSLVTSSYAEAQTAALVSSKQMLVGLEHWRPKPSFGGSR
jgi:glycosyltransferase involved in cell wall biosynthesis